MECGIYSNRIPKRESKALGRNEMESGYGHFECDFPLDAIPDLGSQCCYLLLPLACFAANVPTFLATTICQDCLETQHGKARFA